MKIAMIAFTDNGYALQKEIISNFDEVFTCYDKTTKTVKEWLNEVFYQCNAIVFIGAIGIATRLIANLIVSKDSDPAVIVIDEKSKFVIPILSGHIGGANLLAQRIADLIGAVPVITTATDINNKFAVDVFSVDNNCVIDDITKIKSISAGVLRNETIGFYSDFDILDKLPNQLEKMENGNLGICISLDSTKKPFDVTINLIPTIITLGIGCRKDTKFEDLENFVLTTLEQNHISLKAVKYIASIDLKKDEQCLLEFASKYNIEFTTFTKDQLNSVAGKFSGSEFVKATTGVDNVCERSAVLQSQGKLIMNKIKNNGITIAIAVSDWKCEF